MAGLNHLWCLCDQRITKLGIPSNPVFIGVSSHPFDVAFYNERMLSCYSILSCFLGKGKVIVCDVYQCFT